MKHKQYTDDGVDQCWECKNCNGHCKNDGFLYPHCIAEDKIITAIHENPCKNFDAIPKAVKIDTPIAENETKQQWRGYLCDVLERKVMTYYEPDQIVKEYGRELFSGFRHFPGFRRKNREAAEETLFHVYSIGFFDGVSEQRQKERENKYAAFESSSGFRTDTSREMKIELDEIILQAKDLLVLCQCDSEAYTEDALREIGLMQEHLQKLTELLNRKGCIPS